MKIFPLSDPILLPLAPTIARTIADYLQSIAQKSNINSLQQNWVGDIIDLQPDLYGYRQFQRSIRQIPTSQYQYVSTIAHQLAAKSALTPSEICQNLDLSIPILAVSEKPIQLELDCWYNEASYIYFQIAPKSVATWLNYIHDLPLESLDFIAIASLESMLQRRDCANDLAIYAHARCCSLLALAAREKVVEITTGWQISRFNCLLNQVDIKNRHTAEPNCIFEHPAEQQLIQTLMAVLDVIYITNQQLDSSTESIVSAAASDRHRKLPNWTKFTLDLAHSWIEFDRRCQTFGEIKHQNPQLAIARCGLTAISRRYLQVLLENYLGVEAVVEL